MFDQYTSPWNTHCIKQNHVVSKAVLRRCQILMWCLSICLGLADRSNEALVQQPGLVCSSGAASGNGDFSLNLGYNCVTQCSRWIVLLRKGEFMCLWLYWSHRGDLLGVIWLAWNTELAVFLCNYLQHHSVLLQKEQDTIKLILISI